MSYNGCHLQAQPVLRAWKILTTNIRVLSGASSPSFVIIQFLRLAVGQGGWKETKQAAQTMGPRGEHITHKVSVSVTVSLAVISGQWDTGFGVRRFHIQILTQTLSSCVIVNQIILLRFNFLNLNRECNSTLPE